MISYIQNNLYIRVPEQEICESDPELGLNEFLQMSVIIIWFFFYLSLKLNLIKHLNCTFLMLVIAKKNVLILLYTLVCTVFTLFRNYRLLLCLLINRRKYLIAIWYKCGIKTENLYDNYCNNLIKWQSLSLLPHLIKVLNFNSGLT